MTRALAAAALLALAPGCAARGPFPAEEGDQFYRTRYDHATEADLGDRTGGMRLTLDGGGEDGRQPFDLRMDASGSTWRSSFRVDRSRYGIRLPVFVEVGREVPHVSACAGYFAPDLGSGLVFSASSRTYPFASGFPLRRSRYLVRRLSFYGGCIRGGGFDTALGPYRLTCFAGQNGAWYRGSFVVSGSMLMGARLQRELPGATAAVTLSGGPDGHCTGIDISSRDRRGAWMIEGVVDPTGRGAGVFAARRKARGCAAGFRIYGGTRRDEYQSNGLYASGGRSYSGTTGICLLVQTRRHLPFRTALYAGRSARDDGDERTTACSWRMTVSGRPGPVELKAGYSATERSIEGSMPVPPVESRTLRKSESIDILIKRRRKGRLSYRFTARLSRDGGEKGLAGSVLVGASSKSDAVRLDLVLTGYRSLCGSPSIYLWEPALEGEYPWRTFRGDGARLTLLWRFAALGMDVGGRLACESGEDSRVDLQFSYEF